MCFYQDVLEGLICKSPEAWPECRGFTADSRAVRPGWGFVAIPGSAVDGHDYIKAAVAGGAVFVVYSSDDIAGLPVPAVKVSDSQLAFARLARRFAGDPDKEMQLLGVTGTNGKTTTVYLLEKLFRCGMISTVEYRLGNGKVIPGERTTPDTASLYSCFKEMRQNGLTAAALELSSHALVQKRCGASRFRLAIFTNLTGDHLDYHGDMEHYYAAKKIFFTDMLAADALAVINTDDHWGKRLYGELSCRRVSFGNGDDADYRIGNVDLFPGGVKFSLHAPDGDVLDFSSNLTGFYNVCNLTGVIIGAMDLGMSYTDVRDILAAGVQVPGRLESFALPSGGRAFVDYAHTDDALRNVLTAMRNFVPGRIITVFGAGGDRDRSKRPRMGQCAGELSDKIIITSDNPRSENPETIMAEVASGVPEKAECCLIIDRKKAILQALRQAGPGDAVLIAGKGHEDYQEVKGIKHHFSDREEVENFIRSNYESAACKCDRRR